MPTEPRDLIEDFDAYYRIVDEPVMRRIEREVTGSDHGASSYTTRDQADRLASLLDLAPDKRLLDIGSGAGWPGIYLARTSGCGLILADLPPEGLRRAQRRMRNDGVRGAVIAASGTHLPLRDEALDAATCSDVLCWLTDKLSVLRACRRVLKPRAPLAFFVVTTATDLSSQERERAVQAGPTHVAAGPGYAALSREAGFTEVDIVDVTNEYARTLSDAIEFREAEATELERLLGAAVFVEGQASRRQELQAVHDGLLHRHLVSAVRL